MPRTLPFLFATLAAAGISACTTPSGVWTYDPANNHVGRIYYYERSNMDGSLDERITMFHRDESNVEVYKENGFCQNAAFVSGHMDWGSFSADKITGGQLQPDAQHVDFAFLDWDKDANQLNIHVKFPNSEIREDAPIITTPWHLYDFDLASLTLATQHLSSPQTNFDFGMTLVWTDPSAEDPLIWMGEVTASYANEEERLGTPSRRYELSGSALTGPRSTGGDATLWLATDDGHIIDAVLPVPNHAGYKDMRLRLIKTSDGGADEWKALLKNHFANC